jgi:hypothetical protein
MDYQRPGTENSPSPSDGTRIEEDRVRPLKRTAGSSRPRLPAALPFAIAGILVVSSVAFGATFVRSIVRASPSATPVVVGDENPTDSPSLAPSEAPSLAPSEAPVDAPTEPPTAAPASGDLTLTAGALPGKVQLTWTKYAGADFAYYKVVRSTDATASWPLGAGDTLVAAIDNVGTLAYLDSPGAGTFTYEVFAVKSSETGYAVLASSNVKTVTVSPGSTKPPQPPVSNPADLGALAVKDNGDGTYTFSWNAYKGGIEFNYYKLSGVPYPSTPGYVETGAYWTYVSPDCTSATYRVPSGTWNVNVEAVYYPAGKGAVLAKTSTIKLTVAARPAPPVLGLTLTVTGDNPYSLSWTKYTGDYFGSYEVLRSETTTEPAYPPNGDTVVRFTTKDINKLTFTDTAKAGHTYHYRVVVWTDQTFASVGGLIPACVVAGTLLAASNIETRTAPPLATPTPTSTPTPTPTPRPTPTPTPTSTPPSV